MSALHVREGARASRVKVLPWAIALVLWLITCWISGHLTVRILLVSLTISVFLALAGLGQMVVLSTGDSSFDLSLPYTITFAGYISAGALHAGTVERIVVAIAVGAAAGAANGILTAVLKLPGIISSLAIGYVLYSGILFFSATNDDEVSQNLVGFIRDNADGASALLIVELVIAVMLAGLLTRTVLGYYFHAMGQSRIASALAGVPVKRMIVTSFVISGLLSGCVGVLLAAYEGGAFANLGDIYLLGSVAAIVVGGTSVSGGTTSVAGTLGGALIVTLLVTMLELANFSAGVQDLTEGLVVILIVAVAGLAAKSRGGTLIAIRAARSTDE